MSFMTLKNADAHSEIISTQPSPGQNFDDTPEQIVLLFNTEVDVFPTSIRVYDENAKKVNVGNLPYLEGKEVKADLEDLAPGRYIVTWNVVSPDTHPIRGAFSFVINQPEPSTQTTSQMSDSNPKTDRELIESVISAQQESSAEKGINYLFTFLIFVSISALIAIIFHYLVFLKIPTTETLDKTVFYSCLVLIVSAVASILLHAKSSQGLQASEVFNFSVIRYEIESVFGLVGISRILLAVAILFLWKHREKSLYGYVLISSVVALAFTPALAGHARVGDYVLLAIVLSFVHIISISIWLGGLVILATSIHRDFEIEKVKKISNISLVCVVGIFISGIFAWVRQVGSFEALRETTFGQLLSSKVLLFLLIVLIALFSRIYTRALIKKDSVMLRSQIRKFVIAELLIILCVYALSSVLVNTIPAKQAYDSPITISSPTELATFEFIVDPPKPGRTEIHVYILDINSQPMQLERTDRRLDQQILALSIENKEKGIEPIMVPMRFQGFNHFSALIDIPKEGTWTIKAELNLTDFNQATTSIDVEF